MPVLIAAASVYGVSMTMRHIRLSDQGTRFETKVQVSSLVESILAHLQNFAEVQKKLIDKIITLIKAIPELPATNAASERLFSIKLFFITDTHITRHERS